MTHLIAIWLVLVVAAGVLLISGGWRNRPLLRQLDLADTDPLTERPFEEQPRRELDRPWRFGYLGGWVPVPPWKRGEQDRLRRAYDSANGRNPL
ncbi:hypothetical protein [Phytoactinopolyspora limicola]|uniref:hypothetical protein n=1 Tax=Phytoactinopolyspora limicola TaxID=2715536 RepID=UPI0014073A68|nr:hypothetical protein [Phytoactinopolyspora limicola]